MPYDSSLTDVTVEGGKALRCKFVRGSNGKRCVWAYDHPDERHHDGFQTWTEPEGSDCACGDIRFRHLRADPEDTHCNHPDCGCTEYRPRPEVEEVPLPEEPERKKCPYGEHPFKPFQGCRDKPGVPHCLTCGHVWGECQWHWVEEEPQCKFPQGCHRVVPCDPGCGASWADPAPPQPLRRPPYAVAYSADGHLYEVMLPGDAIVSAVDGALVIKHAQHQIHGIVAVHPIESKEAS